MKNGKITEVYTDSYFNTKSLLKIFRLHWHVLTLRMQVESKLMLVKISDEYILRQDLSAQDVTQYKNQGILVFW
jgi:hypothetical protein